MTENAEQERLVVLHVAVHLPANSDTDDVLRAICEASPASVYRAWSESGMSS